ncbi:MAG: hypothetical protein ACPL1K_06275 [Candidatus Kryptoniota bacterium]
MEKRYSALRLIGSIYKVLGIIVGVLTILIALSLCATSIFGGAALSQFGRQFGGENAIGGAGGVVLGIMMGLVAIIYGGGMAVTLYAVGEGIYLLIALEENTRMTAMLLQKQ